MRRLILPLIDNPASAPYQLFRVPLNRTAIYSIKSGIFILQTI